MTVVQSYFARPGRRSQLLATRREASRRLAELGLPVGAILVADGHADDDPDRVAGGPDVVWICRYRDRQAREHARITIDADAVFREVRRRQAENVTLFEREVLPCAALVERIEPPH